MVILGILFMVGSLANASLLFDSKEGSDVQKWQIVDDVVMGGRSNGNLSRNQDDILEFYGKVSLENNGGFSSARYYIPAQDVSDYSGFVIKVKGDGKSYQFRAKTNSRDPQSYIYHFQTDGSWQEIYVPFEEMYPGYRGRKLNMPNFPGQKLEGVTILIANKKEEQFRLAIQSIQLQ